MLDFFKMLKEIYLINPLFFYSLFIMFSVFLGVIVYNIFLLLKHIVRYKKISLTTKGLNFEDNFYDVKNDEIFEGSVNLVFTSLKLRINNIVSQNLVLLKIKDEGKKELIIDMLVILLETISEYLTKVILVDKNRCQSYIEYFSKAFEEYEQKALKNGIPVFVLKKFRRWRFRYFEHVLTAVDDICKTNIYPSDGAKEIAVLMIIRFGIEMVVSSAEQLQYEINGQLKGFKYKNFVIGEINAT